MFDPNEKNELPEETTYQADDSVPLQRAEPENAPILRAQELLDQPLASGGGSAISEE